MQWKLSRDPALWLTVFASAVRLGAAFFTSITPDQQAWLNAAATAVAGVVVAFWVRRDGQVAALLGMVQAMLALAVGYGLDLSEEAQAAVMSFVGLAAAAFVRTQVKAPVDSVGSERY